MATRLLRLDKYGTVLYESRVLFYLPALPLALSCLPRSRSSEFSKEFH
jgi:hypothetical protein